MAGQKQQDTQADTAKRQPELRFPEFSEDWEEKPLRDVSALVTSGSRDWAQYYSKQGQKFIRMTNLPKKGIALLLHDLKFVHLPEKNADGIRTSLQHGDILISITAELGKIGWIPKNFGEAYINQHTALVRPLKEITDSKFIAHTLSSPKMNKKINRLNDAGAKSGLNLSTVRSFPLNLPSLPEQRKIADFLSVVDDRITGLREKKQLLQDYKKGVMQQIFSQTIRFQDDNGHPFPDWEEKRLGDVFSERTERNYGDMELLSVTMNKGIVKRRHIEGKDNSSTDKSNYKRVKPNDIAYNSMRMWQGANGLSKYDGILSPAYTVVTPSVDVMPEYFVYLFKYKPMVFTFQRNSQGLTSDTWNLKFPAFAKIKIILPKDKEEQKKIANFLTAIDDKITATENQLAHMQSFKNGLLQKLFV